MFDRRPARPAVRTARPKRPLGKSVISLKAGRGGRSAPPKLRSAKPNATPHTKQTSVPQMNTFWSRFQLGLIVFLVLVGAGGVFGWQVVTGQTLDDGPYRILLINQAGKSGRNERLTLVQFVPRKASVQLVELPANQVVEVGNGYGQYQLNAVQPLLALDKQPSHVATAILSETVKVPIDSVYLVDSESQVTNKDSLIKTLWQNKLWAWWKQLRTVQAEDVEQFSVQSVDQLAGLLEPRTERQSDCPLAIVNATQQAGLASEVSALLERGQATVVRTTDQAQTLTKTKLVVSQLESCPVIKRFVQSSLPTEIEFEVNPTLTTQNRAEVVLYLGTDILP